MTADNSELCLKYLGIDTYKNAIIFIPKNCIVCKSEGFEVHTRVRVTLNKHHILATLNTMDNDILANGEASLSKYAWDLLHAKDGDIVNLAHPKPLHSLSYMRSKIYGHELKAKEVQLIIEDIAKGNYSDIHISSFLTACAGGGLNNDEVIQLTHSMINVGERLSWPKDIIVDKHCVGGLPGNRTTPIVVSIVTAFGMTMPKTSSRAITSPAGTADTMEVLAPVDLNIDEMKRVVKQENGCIVWGGAVDLSPADDILIRVAHALELDTEGQLIASVLSKKISAGSTHIVIDIPVGPSAKIRSLEVAYHLRDLFEVVARALKIHLKILISDGNQPVGRGIGPALEAMDVLDVLMNAENAPEDLRNRSLSIASSVIEFSPDIKKGEGLAIAKEILEDGRAWKKFQAICNAQGGMREPQVAKFCYQIESKCRGKVISIDNRLLSRLAKLTGAPHDKSAGIKLYTPLDTAVEKGQLLYSIHSESKGELNYAISLLDQIPCIVQVEAYE